MEQAPSTPPPSKLLHPVPGIPEGGADPVPGIPEGGAPSTPRSPVPGISDTSVDSPLRSLVPGIPEAHPVPGIPEAHPVPGIPEAGASFPPRLPVPGIPDARAHPVPGIPEGRASFPPRSPVPGIPDGHAFPPRSPVPPSPPDHLCPELPQPGPWSTGLSHFCEDPCNATVTCFFPCVTFGRIAEILDDGQTSCVTSAVLYALISCFLVPWIYSCTYRTKLRGKFRLVQSPCSDCLTHCCCECCALSQEYRELKNRGLDPRVGWTTNQNKLQEMADSNNHPPMKQVMRA